jgi:hypothetical protein
MRRNDGKSAPERNRDKLAALTEAFSARKKKSGLQPKKQPWANKSAGAKGGCLHEIEVDTPPVTYLNEKQAPYLVAIQRNDLRYLVYLDGLKPHAVIDSSGGDRPMTATELRTVSGLIRNEMRRDELSKIDHLLPTFAPSNQSPGVPKRA